MLARYVRSSLERQIPTLVVVISEDGGVDFIPDPPPKIRRADLSQAISEIEAIAQSETPGRLRYNQLYDWLRTHEFYMLNEDCRRANAAVEKIETRLFELNPSAARILRDEFKVNPSMAASFYYEPEGSPSKQAKA